MTRDRKLNTPNKSSLVNNGINGFEIGATKLTTESKGKSYAKSVAKKILTKYNDGLADFSANWIGTPEAKLGDAVSCWYSMEDNGASDYELLSNEFTFNGSLRAKTVLREIKKGPIEIEPEEVIY